MAAKAVNPRVEKMAQVIGDYLGKDYKMILNDAGDPVFVNANNTRKIRFDAFYPHGYEPHGHVQIKVGRDWEDYIPGQHHIKLREEPNLENNFIDRPDK